ncbi:hypothetical protein [Micromonospora yangpuensis]|uniref:Uncharacterized protein n=1 Tax=Micromonospora yangpuensis TaxID=683228 RepID=A0A1C6UFW3_9ACTN|nr:hypothetical protein [Micromonospora yangpuensis]SCL52773.1 hypothetical protein GA0070617_2173 [Micromonospora yangpuensis]
MTPITAVYVVIRMDNAITAEAQNPPRRQSPDRRAQAGNYPPTPTTVNTHPAPRPTVIMKLLP